jgi:kinesin family protein 6/9
MRTSEKYFSVMQTITTYLRCRPPSKSNEHNARDRIILQTGSDQVSFLMTSESNATVPRNHGSLTLFDFKAVLGPEVNQENVFKEVCTDVIESVLRGVNGTIFAYGQTGSGKTYTVTGSTDSYSQRGLIPRCLEKLFTHTLNPTTRFDV